MATLSIRIPDDLLDEIDKNARLLKVARAEYIRRAVEEKNETAALEAKRRRMKNASERVRKESMRILADFEAFPDELP